MPATVQSYSEHVKASPSFEDSSLMHERSKRCFDDFLTFLGTYVAQTKRPQHTPLDCVSIPEVSINEYVERLQDCLQLDEATFSQAAGLMGKLKAADVRLAPTCHNIHRLVLLCLLLAHKFLDDVPYFNKTFAMAGGLPLFEVNKLEVWILKKLQWNVSLRA
mmetsp:Transcript_17885/g.38871  ORF Transcript_17885/g.38871 Transcript_17885/m.38871 type:complete len:162 (-) Transcript_17885:178-663(-)